jgi:chemotaxis protein methyltransferase CheR
VNDRNSNENDGHVIGATPRLEAREFAVLRELVYRLVGISLNDAKRTLVESRLQRRLRAHKFGSFVPYVKLLSSCKDTDDEIRELINCITTNKTSFFREPHHFEFLAENVLPRLRTGPVSIWSAGCSTGEEPYTIAMTTLDRAPSGSAGRMRIFASDIDTQVLATARQGVYPVDRLEGLDDDLLKRHFLRGTGAQEGLVRARPELQKLITFDPINLMGAHWQLPGPFDVIFCRNVIIYFDRPTQERLLERFALALKPGGYLILGHSENIHWKSSLFQALKHTVYRLSGAADAATAAESDDTAVRPPVQAASPPKPAPPPPVPGRTRVSSTPLDTPAPRGRAAQADEDEATRAAHAPAHREHRLSITDHAGVERPVVRIEAGMVHASKSPVEIRTLLGSCVSACLYDPINRLGGMNHFMLPSGNDEDSASARYGVHAMELLINDLMKLGASRQRMQAKVFGAASVIRLKRTGPEVGEMNADFVLRFLEAEGIPLLGKQLGGTSPLEVRMESDTGKVRTRALQSDLMNQIVAEERRRTIATVQSEKRASECDVTLF